MPKREVAPKEKEEILKRVQREFPCCKAPEIEEQTMTYDEIIRDTKKGSNRQRRNGKFIHGMI